MSADERKNSMVPREKTGLRAGSGGVTSQERQQLRDRPGTLVVRAKGCCRGGGRGWRAATTTWASQAVKWHAWRLAGG